MDSEGGAEEEGAATQRTVGGGRMRQEDRLREGDGQQTHVLL